MDPLASPEIFAPRILFVDDEATAVKYFQRAIGPLAPVVSACSVDEGIVLLEKHANSLVVLVSDQRMPGRFGNELLRHARERYPHMVRILTTAYSEIEYTVEAINEGQIHRYIKKPWEISALRMELRQALELADLRLERDALVRDKLLVRQQQVLAQRIGMLELICATWSAEVRNAYLAAALAAGARAPIPDWRELDYADLVELETQRASLFRVALDKALHVLPPAKLSANANATATANASSNSSDLNLDNANDMLRRSLPEALLPEPDLHEAHMHKSLSYRFADPSLPAEYLSGELGIPVSPAHAAWLAALVGLVERGLTWRNGHLVPLQQQSQTASDDLAPLAAWIEQFQQSAIVGVALDRH